MTAVQPAGMPDETLDCSTLIVSELQNSMIFSGTSSLLESSDQESRTIGSHVEDTDLLEGHGNISSVTDYANPVNPVTSECHPIEDKSDYSNSQSELAMSVQENQSLPQATVNENVSSGEYSVFSKTNERLNEDSRQCQNTSHEEQSCYTEIENPELLVDVSSQIPGGSQCQAQTSLSHNVAASDSDSGENKSGTSKPVDIICKNSIQISQLDQPSASSACSLFTSEGTGVNDANKMLSSAGLVNEELLEPHLVHPPEELLEPHHVQPPEELLEPHHVQPPEEVLEPHHVQPPEEVLEPHHVQVPEEVLEPHHVQPPVELLEPHHVQPPVELLEPHHVQPREELLEPHHVQAPEEMLEPHHVASLSPCLVLAPGSSTDLMTCHADQMSSVSDIRPIANIDENDVLSVSAVTSCLGSTIEDGNLASDLSNCVIANSTNLEHIETASGLLYNQLATEQSASVGPNEPPPGISDSHILIAPMTADKEHSPTVSEIRTCAPRIKAEPLDTGYDHADTNSGHTFPHSMNLNQHSSKVANATNTTRKRRKKRVRIKIIRGEWRTPSQTKFQNTNTSSCVSNSIGQSTINQDNARNVIKREPSETFASPSSAFPTALYRNIHIKTEPFQDGYPDTSPAAPEPISTHNATSSCFPQTATSFHSEQVPSFSSSHAFKEREEGRYQGRGRGRKRVGSVNGAIVSSEESEQITGTTSRKMMESQIRYCSVQLKQLEPDVLATGTVNLKTDPQVMKTYNRREKGCCEIVESARPLIKVMDPQAFHPVKKRDRLGPRPWSCELCNKTFKTASARSQHKKIHVGIKEHKCHVCYKAFMYKSTLTAHYRSHTDERPYVCKLCGAGFRWANHLTNHLGTHSQIKPFKCEQCGKTFTQKANLITHMKRHTGIRSHKCPKCDSTFMTKAEAASHMKTHTGEKPYQCDQCKASFAQNNTLLVHLRSHNDERPFQCHLCPAAFRQSSHRRTHVHLIHEKPQKEGYKPRVRRKPVSRGPKSVTFDQKAVAGKRKMKTVVAQSDDDDDDDITDDPDWNPDYKEQTFKK